MRNQNYSSRKKRRTEEDIKQDLYAAIESLVAQKGFRNIAITEIMKKADVEPSVVYKRYKDIEELFDKFVRQYDYWFYDLTKEYIQEKTPVLSMKNILVNLADSLYDNQVMQKILAWEISDTNETTSRMSQSRELHSIPLLNFFRGKLPTEINFDCLTALLIGGIYYLILHRDISTFCGIDFKSGEGKSLLIETIGKIIEKVYATDACSNEADIRMQEKIKIVQSMIANNIDPKTIEEIIGLPISEIAV